MTDQDLTSTFAAGIRARVLTENMGSVECLLLPPGFVGGNIPMPDGTLAAPQGANFALELGLGIWRPAANLLGFAVNNGVPFLPAQIGTGSQLNVDPVSPSTVRYAYRGFMPAVGAANEVTHFYARVDPTVGNPQQAALYIDITSAQLDTQGPAIKVIHAGAGDGVYVAMFGAGSGYECATWADGSRGYISTIQVPGLPNSTLFNALWDQPDVPNFGMYYADLATANALTIRRRDSTGVAGLTQIRLIEELGRQRFGLFNDGSARLQGDVATALGPVQASPELELIGAAWDGAASQPTSYIVKVVPSALDDSILEIVHVSPGGTEVDLQLSSDGVGGDPILVLGPTGAGQYRGADLQSPIRLNLLSGGGNLDATLDTPTAANDTCLTNFRLKDSAGTDTSKNVAQGAADSAGVGFRALVVPNDGTEVTAVVAGDFAATNWGTAAPTIAVTTGSTCRRGEVSVTCNDVDATNGWDLTLTFPTAFAAQPFAIAVRNDDVLAPPEVTSMSARVKPGDVSTTTLKITPYPGGGSPVNGNTYVFVWMVME